MTTPYNESAFPMRGSQIDEDMGNRQFGMTLRDYFAAAVMTGLMYASVEDTEGAAAMAYRYADAMLAERTKP